MASVGLGSDELELLQYSVDRFVQDKYPLGDGPAGIGTADHWEEIASLGWLALCVSEASGGLGGVLRDAQVVARALGTCLAPDPFLETVAAIRLLDELSAHSELLGQIIAGELLVVLAHSEAQFDLGFRHVGCRAVTDGQYYRVSGTKSVVRAADKAKQVVVSVLLDGVPALVLVPLDAVGLVLDEFPTIDGRQAADLHFHSVSIDHSAILAQGQQAEGSLHNAFLFAMGCALGELDGICESTRTATSEYLDVREQFGQRLANFQALQHLFSDIVMSEEEIRSLAWLVANAWDADDDFEREQIIRKAKARSGSLSRELVETAVQLHGGLGVSDEYVVGHYLRRVIAIDAMFGDSADHLLWQAEQYAGPSL